MRHTLPKKLQNFPHNLNNFEKGLFWVFTTWGTYFLYIWPKMLFRTSAGIFSGWVNIWGDFAAHFSYSTPFLYNPPSTWLTHHPLYIESKFTYPFAADAISGILARFGLDIVWAFVLPSIVFSLLLLYMVYKFTYVFTKSALVSYLNLTAFLTSGGLGFLWLFAQIKKDPTLILNTEYTNMRAVGIDWINTITSEVLPQRAFLIGVPITLIIILIINNWYKTKFKDVSVLKVVLVGFLSSSLVFIHVHSLIVLVFVSAIYFLYSLKYFKWWVIYAVSSAITLVPVYLYLYKTQITQSFFKWYPGWMANPNALDKNIFYFWFLNWGLFIPIFIFAYFYKRFYKNPLASAAIVIFTVANLILFQPHNWDNSKILSYAFLFMGVFVCSFLKELFNKNLLFKAAVVIMILTFTLSGALDIARLFDHKNHINLMYSQSDLILADNLNSMINPGDVVLTSDKHDHWVTNLTKAQILLGYKGWLWTYGIDYQQVYQDTITIFSASPSAENLIDKYNIQYVVIGPLALKEYKANKNYFESKYPLVLSNQDYSVYKVR